MSFLVAVGISVGILAGLWTGVSTQYAAFGLVTYVGFLSWASFYAGGGKVKGLKDSLILNFSGVLWAWLIVWLPYLHNCSIIRKYQLVFGFWLVSEPITNSVIVQVKYCL